MVVTGMNHKTGCLVCGAELVYFPEDREQNCNICGTKEWSSASCSQGHFICDNCHSMSANDWIEQHCLQSDVSDPVQLANQLMDSPLVKMHGPEHHYLVPAVLLTVYYNVLKQENRKSRALQQARQRAEKVLGGFCGFWGTCGAAIGNGIFYSVITGSTPVSVDEWRTSNLLTSQTLKNIAEHGGPRCCKRDVYLSLLKAVEFIQEELKTDVEIKGKISCEYSRFNRECLTRGCPFYKPLNRE
jgi:hypothetical protein